MYEIKNFHKNVLIEGNILFDTDKEVSYTDLVALSTFDKMRCTKIISADNIKIENGREFRYVTNDLICEDDVIYQVTDDIVSFGSEIKTPNPYNSIYTYNNNILDIKNILESNVNKTRPFGSTDISCNLIFRTLNSLSSVNRMLYQAVLSNYELFAMDILVTCFLRFEEVRDSYLKRNRFSGLSYKEVILKLRDYQYNNFEPEIENLFLTLLDVTLPDYSFLVKAYNLRNDFAHRYYTTVFGEALVVTDDSLKELISETNKFVYLLFEKIIEKVY